MVRTGMPRFDKGRMAFRQYFALQTRDSTGLPALDSKTNLSGNVIEGSILTIHDGLPVERHDSTQPSISDYDRRQAGIFEPVNMYSKEPSSGFTKHHLPKHSIPAFITSDIVALQLPDPPPPAGISISSNFDIKSLSQAHFHAFRPPNASNSVATSEWTIEAATKQVKILRKAFPLVDSRSALLSMCAWFHLFCFYDDATEKMPAKEARLVMKHSMRILEVACQTKKTSQNLSRTMSPVQRAKIFYTLWLSSRLPSGGLVAGATYLFVQQAQRLLGPEALRRVATKITHVFNGYYREISCRECVDHLSVDEYSKLRSSTIGLSPFWEILRDNYFTGSEANLAQTASFTLESQVAAVVGLQNDLVGLANDRANGDRMNYVLLRAERESLGLGQAMTAAIELHNWTVRRVVDERQRFERTLPDDWKENDGMRMYADCMLGFMTTHLMWASSAGRYKCV